MVGSLVGAFGIGIVLLVTCLACSLVRRHRDRGIKDESKSGRGIYWLVVLCVYMYNAVQLHKPSIMFLYILYYVTVHLALK